jgi:hypothetical protein
MTQFGKFNEQMFMRCVGNIDLLANCFARIRSIVTNPMRIGETIWLDGVIRMAPN